MVITYYGALCFKVQSGDTVLAFNPPSKESSYKSPRFQAGAVLISTNGKDYNGADNLSGKSEEAPFIIDGKGEYEILGIYIKGIGNGDVGNTIYALSMEDINICHLGALNKELSPAVKEEIGEVDILFLPIGGEMMDPQKAASLAANIEPKVIIPMNYKDEDLKLFLKEFGATDAKPAEKLTIKRKELAEKKSEVVVLEPAV